MQALGYVSQRHNGHLSYLTFDHCYSVNLQQVSRQPIGKPTIPTASPKRAVKSIEKPEYVHLRHTYTNLAEQRDPVARFSVHLVVARVAFLSERIPHHARPSTARLRFEPGVPYARLILV
jgi:hypothetical protein